MSFSRGSAAAFLVVAALAFGVGAATDAAPRWFLLQVGLAALLAWVACRKTISLPAGTCFVAVLAAWWVFSLLWSPDPRQGLQQLLLTAPFAGAFLLGRALPVPRIVLAVMVGSAGLYALFPGVYGGLGNENFVAEVVLLSLPLALSAVRADWQRALVLILAAAVFAFNGSHVEFGVAAVIGLAFLAGRIPRAWWLLVVIPAGFFVAWEVAPAEIRVSVLYRAELMLCTLTAWLEHPVFGWGLGSFAYVYPSFQECHRGLWNGTAVNGLFAHAGAAHNEFAQLLMETGVVGFILAAVFLWWVWPEKWGARWTLYLALALSLFEFPLQNPHTGLIVALALGYGAQPGFNLRVALPGRMVAVAAGALMLWVAGHYAVSSLEAGAAAEARSPGERLGHAMRAYTVWPLGWQTRLGLVGRAREFEVAGGDIADDLRVWIETIGETAAPDFPGLLAWKIESRLGDCSKAGPLMVRLDAFRLQPEAHEASVSGSAVCW